MESQQILLPTNVFGDLKLREGDVIEGTTGDGVVRIRLVSRKNDAAEVLSNEQLLA